MPNKKAPFDHRFRSAWIFAFVLSFLSTGVCFAKDLIVDGKSAAARDANAGTLEAPFKTIQAAMDKAQPGDTVLVRGGVYHEGVAFKRSGESGGAAWNDPQNVRWISLEAYKDERVVLDGSLALGAEVWKRVEGCANTYVTPFERKGWGSDPVEMVFVNDAMIPPSLAHAGKAQPGLPMVPAVPGDKTSDEGWYHDQARNLLFVNLGGRVPGKDAQVAAAQLSIGVWMMSQSFVRVQGLEIRRFNARAILGDCCRDFVVQDNYIHHCGEGPWCCVSSGGIIRGNTFSDIMVIALSVGESRGTVVEGNLFRNFHVNPFKTDGGQSCNYYSAAIMCNSSFGLLARNNIITEGDVDGVWPDCGSTGLVLYGNAIYGLKSSGFYIEQNVCGAVLQWNTVFENENGIVFRQNYANSAFENYVFNNRRGGLGIGTCDADRVKVDSMMYNWVIGNAGVGASFGPDISNLPAHSFDHNVYCGNGLLFQFGDKQYKDIKSVRDDVGMEIHGQEVKDFDPAPLGLATFRVNGTKESWKPVPMFGNPGATRIDLQEQNEIYFWKKGTFLKPEPYGWRCEGFGGVGGWTRERSNGYMRQLSDWFTQPWVVQNDPSFKVDKGADDLSALWKNGYCLQVCAAPGKAVSSEGLGYWGLKLPTTDDARIDLSLWVRAKDVKPAGTNGGVYALAEFFDETGQNASRQYVAGGNDGEKAVGEKWVAGTYEYQKVSGMVTAPKGARWFRMGMGIRNCTGWAAFNNFDIQTRPGEKPHLAEAVLPIEAKRYKWAPCDLTGLLNRPLADEVDGDGKGGWTDQGPTMDLRNLYAGDYTYNGVAFRVAKGNACFIMKNKQRPSQNLPDGGKVELKGKADVLAFLHSGGWIQPDVLEATYVIHYADGAKVKIPVIGGKNIFDWASGPTVLEGQKYDPELGFTQRAVTVPVPKFVSGYVWMTLWKNPRPDKQIVALEVKGENQGIPGLIGVSFGVAK